MRTKRLTLSALLLAAALTIFVIEAQLPPLVPIPGVKLGLANVITLEAIYILGRKEAFLILALRILLGSIFTGNLFALCYSAAGGLMCFLAMSLASYWLDEKNMWLVSILGAAAHNMGQIAAAFVLTGVRQVIYYLPVLLISGVVTGLFTGMAAKYVFFALKKQKYIKDIKK
ncbi:MAG: Gx transporter family protein [Clostridiales bacterium]|nr:Gx transporter family protein [Clostridiales bacterium]